MILKNIALLGLALVAAAPTLAQETKTEYEFHPHWYVQGQFGAQQTLGEVSFGDLLSPNAQVSVGYNLNKYFGLRAGVNAWQSKAGWDQDKAQYNWKWSYVAPSVDAVANLSTLFFGFNPERPFVLSAFAGLGVNIAFNNDEAADVDAAIGALNHLPAGSHALRNLWDGTKVRMQGRLGLMADYRINDKFSVGAELQANLLNDNYNSKMAKNADWYFNALVGVKYTFGKSYSKKTVVVPAAVAPGQERVVEKIVEKEVLVPGEVKEIRVVEPLRQDVYFTINSTAVSLIEMQKVKDLAAYLKKYPEAKVTITGHADKDTGNARINKMLSEKRAQVVADVLVKQMGIDASRIIVEAKGDTEQPHAEPVLNRVSICIAK
ncbi:major outer membrane protein OmpA [gut metagenome]|uniref:Major outer membrane protein OmpA n=1 Tax=gut metagenome TaxID=749906 RepID=J9CV49_9ZZZZ